MGYPRADKNGPDEGAIVLIPNHRPSNAGNSYDDDDDDDDGVHISDNRRDNRGQQRPEVHIPDNSRDGGDGGDGDIALQKIGPDELSASFQFLR